MRRALVLVYWAMVALLWAALLLAAATCGLLQRAWRRAWEAW